MTKGRRSREEWRQLMAEWRASGESQGSFAKRRGIRPRTFAWWIWNLKREADEALEQACFVPVEVRDVQTSDTEERAVAVLDHGRAQLRIAPEADPRWVAALLIELGAC